MQRERRSLRGEVAALFERACQENDYLVADYLLQALEAIGQHDGDEQLVDRAYLEMARSVRMRRSQ